MKLQKESFWLFLSLLSVPFYFSCCETLEVKDGVLTAYRSTWWCKKVKVKSLKTSRVREVCTRSRGCGGRRAVSIEVMDERGQLFWSQRYQGFDKVGRSCRDAVALRYAIKTGAAFSSIYCRSAGWTILMITTLFFIWIYKLAWRLERERRERSSDGC